MDKKTLQSAQIIWNYMRLGHEPRSADCLLVLGSRDDRVASYAAVLAKQYVFDRIAITGGSAHHNDLLGTNWAEPTEAEHFATIMRDSGYGGELILETNALNTGDNAVLSQQLLKRKAFTPKSMLIVTKPYMERRVKATFDVQWSDRDCDVIVISPPVSSLNEYCNEESPIEETITIMVGDLQRIIDYPEKGFQSYQAIPLDVQKAAEQLKNAGFTGYLQI